jgi:hypothetical protein
MKEGRIFNPPSTLTHPQDTKEKKNLTYPHPNICLDNIVNVDCPHIVLTYSLILHLPSLQNTQQEEKTPSLHLNCWIVHTFIKESTISLVNFL